MDTERQFKGASERRNIDGGQRTFMEGKVPHDTLGARRRDCGACPTVGKLFNIGQLAGGFPVLSGSPGHGTLTDTTWRLGIEAPLICRSACYVSSCVVDSSPLCAPLLVGQRSPRHTPWAWACPSPRAKEHLVRLRWDESFFRTFSRAVILLGHRRSIERTWHPDSDQAPHQRMGRRCTLH